MHKSIELQNTTTVTKSINRSALRRGLLLIPAVFALAWLTPSPQVQAVCEEGCDLTNENTFLGDNALSSNTTGAKNTAMGSTALSNNRTGRENTATGFNALASNTTGEDNTAIGEQALVNNTTGPENMAVGAGALFSNTTGSENTATGYEALYMNTTGSDNTATGYQALLNNTTGNNSIALGVGAGSALTTGKNNIDIGNVGVAGEANKIRIGTTGTQRAAFIAGISGVPVPAGVGVIVGTDGKLGTVVSSERFKEEIKPMDKASEAILALKPVTFRYKHELDPSGIPQFGLVAEQVEKVNPALVARDDRGKPYTVRYEAVNAMLLNEFLKEHRKVQNLEAALAILNERLKAQDAKIDKVNAQVELTKPAPQMTLNRQ